MDKFPRDDVHAETHVPRSGAAIVGLASLGLVLLIAGVQFVMEVIASLKDFSLFKGILGSPWAGLDNYKVFLFDSGGIKVIANTISYNLLFAGFCFILSLAASSVISSFSKRSILRDALAALAILPVFIPGEVYADWFYNLLGSLPFTNAVISFFLLPFLASLKYVGVPVMVIHILGILNREKDTLLPVKCSGLFSLTAISLAGVGHFSLLYEFLNPLIMPSADILDTYSFRTGFMNMEIGVQAAAGVVQVLLCLVFMAILFIPVKMLYKTTFHREKEYIGRSIPGTIMGSVLALLVFVLLFLLPYILKGKLSGFSEVIWFSAANMDPAGTSSEGTALVISPAVIVPWVFISLTAALLGTGIAFAAGSFARGSRKARIYGVSFLLLITLLTVRPFTFSGYLSLRSAGLINTYMAIIVALTFSSAAVWAFAAMQREGHGVGSKELLFGVIGVFLIQSALNYGNGTPALIYLSQPGMSPLLLYKSLAATMHLVSDYSSKASLAGSLCISGLTLTLPPVLIFLAVKVILPIESMLAVIAAGRKQ